MADRQQHKKTKRKEDALESSESITTAGTWLHLGCFPNRCPATRNVSCSAHLRALTVRTIRIALIKIVLRSQCSIVTKMSQLEGRALTHAHTHTGGTDSDTQIRWIRHAPSGEIVRIQRWPVASWRGPFARTSAGFRLFQRIEHNASCARSRQH